MRTVSRSATVRLAMASRHPRERSQQQRVFVRHQSELAHAALMLALPPRRLDPSRTRVGIGLGLRLEGGSDVPLGDAPLELGVALQLVQPHAAVGRDVALAPARAAQPARAAAPSTPHE